jgi:outer membrane immunogenic protein
MKRIVAFSFLSLAGTIAAAAADFPPPWQNASGPPGVYSTAATSKSWGGVYLGLNGGYGLGSSQWSLGGNPSAVFDPNGFLAGGTVGFNFPISEVLFGFEGDLDWARFDGSIGNCAVNAAGAAAACETKSNFLGTARARAGYAFDHLLVFVTGGAAFGNVQTGLNPPASFDNATKVGWTAGAGIEYALSPDWSAKAEYLYVNLGSASCNTLANCGGAAGASVVLTENLVRGGVNYKFSW